ncbi:hypothetical protein HHI36_022376 [Cryptolaemus montrouzieri]|uniref:Endonuclease/exonuclease/phosphatase domain-containing protein n=1 Tax=Cryptolaemus montrouzieri TaxID=559131 RepID=A0ABD2MZW6_9CUCU
MALSDDKTPQQARQLQELRDDLKARSYSDTEPVFILTTESWFHSGIPDQCFSISGYSIFRCDSLTTPGYAGDCIYALNIVLDTFLISSYSLHTPGIDNIFLDVNSKDFSTTIACIYHPRSSEHDKTIFDHIENLSLDTGKNTFIDGDFNFGDIGQLVTKPTRYGIN